MTTFEIVKDDETKMFTTTLVMSEGDRFYLPRFEKNNYMLVPKGYVLYYPFVGKYTPQFSSLRIDYDFTLVKGAYQWKSMGRDTYSPRLDLDNSPIDYRFLLHAWYDINLKRHWSINDNQHRFNSIYWRIKKLEDKGYERVPFIEDIKIDNITIEERESNTKLTSKFYFSSKYHHAKILNRLRRQAPVREAERILEEVASE